MGYLGSGELNILGCTRAKWSSNVQGIRSSTSKWQFQPLSDPPMLIRLHLRRQWLHGKPELDCPSLWQLPNCQVWISRDNCQPLFLQLSYRLVYRPLVLGHVDSCSNRPACYDPIDNRFTEEKIRPMFRTQRKLNGSNVCTFDREDLSAASDEAS